MERLSVDPSPYTVGKAHLRPHLVEEPGVHPLAEDVVEDHDLGFVLEVFQLPQVPDGEVGLVHLGLFGEGHLKVGGLLLGLRVGGERGLPRPIPKVLFHQSLEFRHLQGADSSPEKVVRGEASLVGRFDPLRSDLVQVSVLLNRREGGFGPIDQPRKLSLHDGRRIVVATGDTAGHLGLDLFELSGVESGFPDDLGKQRNRLFQVLLEAVHVDNVEIGVRIDGDVDRLGVQQEVQLRGLHPLGPSDSHEFGGRVGQACLADALVGLPPLDENRHVHQGELIVQNGPKADSVGKIGLDRFRKVQFVQGGKLDLLEAPPLLFREDQRSADKAEGDQQQDGLLHFVTSSFFSIRPMVRFPFTR